jgi:carbamoyl-phosphate synthase large subunit
MLRANGERDLHIVGVDMRNEAIGRFLADSFHQVPPAHSEDYIPAMLRLVRNESPDVLFPQSSYEVPRLASHKRDFQELGISVMVSDSGPIDCCVDKAVMYQKLGDADVPAPRVLYPESLREFISGVERLGYPEVDVCFKPHVSKGGRGFRILSERIDEAKTLLHERPNNLYMTLASFERIFKSVPSFPRLLLMEYVSGEEYTVDALVHKGDILLGMVKSREAINTGLAMRFRTVSRPDLMEYAKRILARIPLDYFVNIQFKGEKLLEVNPRVSTCIYQSDLNLPYLGIKWALGEIDREGLADYQGKVDHGRRSIRYYDQVFWTE